MGWSSTESRAMAESCIGDAGDRWLHVRGVAELATQLRDKDLGLSDAVVAAAWLHDVGYAPELTQTGFHPIDGARWLRSQGVPEGVVALVAYHSGASFEAEERKLVVELAKFPEPDPDQLDMLTLVDLAVGPTGERVSVESRLDEILARYPADDPVHRAVTRSRSSLIQSAERAAERLGLANVGTRPPI